MKLANYMCSIKPNNDFLSLNKQSMALKCEVLMQLFRQANCQLQK